MHPAAPGAAEASRGRPAVKAGEPPADDDHVTSVAYVPDDSPEPVSPELALVDPTLAERLRADLREPAEPERVEPTAEASPVSEAPVPELEAEPEPEPVEVVAEEPAPTEPEPHPPLADEPDPPSASIHVLRPAPAPAEPASVEIEEAPEPAVEPRPVPRLELAAELEPAPEVVTAREPEPVYVPEPVVSAPGREVVPVQQQAYGAPVTRLPVIPTPPATAGKGKSTVSPLRRRSRMWQLLVLLATIVLFAGVVTVGVVVVSELRGGPSSPSVAAPQPEPRTDEPSATPVQPVQPSGDGASAATPRRFAWAPVDGAVSYRFELFRGDVQVLRATTPQPAYELPTSWQHDGREERLTSGSYQWYVWPVLASGPADSAVVQARLDVP